MNRKYTIETIKELSPDEIDELYNLVTSMRYVVTDRQAQNKIIWNYKPKVCPYCGDNHFVRNGHTKSGSQKLLCRSCGRSFSSSTDSVGHRSQEDYQKWIKFVECELNGLTHRRTAEIVGINRNTALLWRHKFYDALGYLQEQKLSGHVEIDAKNMPINFKGSKRENMPRAPKSHQTKKSKGKNNHTSCIVSAIDEEDHIVLKVAGYGKETTEMYLDVLSDKIQKDSVVVTDGFQGFDKVAKKLKCNHEVVKSNCHTNERGYNINSINQVHSELSTHMKRYHGVSARHLQGYLNMFVLLKYLKFHVDYRYQRREAYIAGMPHITTITKANEYKRPYLTDMNEVYADYHTTNIPNQ